MDIKVKKTGRVYAIDESKVPAHIDTQMKHYGWKQFLGDSLSQFSVDGTKSTTKATPDEMHVRIEDTIARLYAGEWRSARAVDSVGKMAYALAMKKVVNKWLKDNPGKDVKLFVDKAARTDEYYDAHRSQYDEMAESIIALTSAEDTE